MVAALAQVGWHYGFTAAGVGMTIGNLLGGNLSLTAAGWNGLLLTNVNLLSYLDQLAINLNVKAGDTVQWQGGKPVPYNGTAAPTATAVAPTATAVPASPSAWEAAAKATPVAPPPPPIAPSTIGSMTTP